VLSSNLLYGKISPDSSEVLCEVYFEAVPDFQKSGTASFQQRGHQQIGSHTRPGTIWGRKGFQRPGPAKK
ncbi:hypothetical protein, partial [uncultured Alistipes sp.]|uniref:hypothetical protein n=1 Tax=uncultured Alistipes sp. TaxID=538949 RepID=UPI00266CDB06